MNAGVVRRVNGPLVEIEGLAGLAMAELLQLGEAGLPAEVTALSGGRATAQAYEYTGGLRPGEPVQRLSRPLAARLGPGLTGGVYDGLLRPLAGADTWLSPGAARPADPRAWTFTPGTAVGTRVGPGDQLGTVSDAGPVEHRVLVPPGVQGRLDALRPAGRYQDDEPVATIDGTQVALTSWWPVRKPRPYPHRLPSTAPLVTGQRVLDAVFPILKGGAASVPGGFGTGKTVLLQQIAKWCDADVIVYVGCGERGNELADVLAELAQLTDPRTGGRLADRTVTVANTSNMPIMAREASIYTGVTVAEYYRDMGYDTVVIADSTSRWAEALREFASRIGALPAEEGYPAGLASALAAFYERAGRVAGPGGREGSVTIVGAVSPPGGDLTEPVTAHTQRFVRTLWTLDRDLANARHYPAVSWSGSYSRDSGTVGSWYAGNGDPGWAARASRMVTMLAEADRLAALADLVGAAALPGPERVALLGGRLLREAFLQQNALSPNDAFCAPTKSAALADLVFDVVDRSGELVAAGRPPGDVENLTSPP
ncbi:ATP synthase subunit A [Phytohabitans flavus]|uniref:V-type ATP synthase subunit A n=1 Tax=Phytohabitans flavus TaxID=1076124 RepID=UPI0031E73A3B